MAIKKTKKKTKLIIGWREWIKIPSLGIGYVKAKIDTGARTSSLHAYDLKYEKRRGKDYVKFKVHPLQKNSVKKVRCEAEVFEYRKVRSSNGHVSKRPVILAEIEMMGQIQTIELTLANRDEMGFRMLLGRQSFKGLFLVDVSKSYYSSKPKLKKTNKVSRI